MEGIKDSSYLKSSSLEGTLEYKTCQCTPPSGTLVHHITHVPLCRLLGVGGMLCSFVVRCSVASVAFSPTGLTFKIAQLCMNGKQYPLPSGPNVTYFIFKGCRAQSDPLCNYDLLKMIPNYQQICGLVSGSKLRAVALYYSQNNFPWVDGLSTKIPVLRSLNTTN